MARLAVTSKFCLAVAVSMFLFLSGISLPPLGVILLPFVTQPILWFGFTFGIGAGWAVAGAAFLLFLIFAGEDLAFIYGLFAVMGGLLLSLLGRIRAIEYLVGGIAADLVLGDAPSPLPGPGCNPPTG